MAGYIMLKVTLRVVCIVLIFNVNTVLSKEYSLPIISGVGGEFTAVNNDGQTIDLSDYAGNVAVIAFGYTSCADICPFTLGYLKQLYARLSSAQQQQVNIIFVTVDPDYDTPQHLASFLAHFNEGFIGISGTKQQTDYIVSLYQAEYNKLAAIGMPTQNIRRVQPKLFADKQQQKNDTATLFSHSVSLYLIDKEGFTRSIEYTGTPKDEFSDKIIQLLNE